MSKKYPLLILEDDPVQQALIERMLPDAKYALTITSEPEEALAAFEKLQYPVVLLDLHLPNNGSGIEVLRRLLETPKPPIGIMLSGDNDIHKIIDAMRAGAYDYVLKPVSAGELNGAVEKALQQAHTVELTRAAEAERSRRMNSQLATKHVVERLQRRQDDKFAAALFGNIHTSFSQGKGVGVMTSLVSMLAGAAAAPDGKSYLVDKDVLDMILENQTAVNDMVQMFSELQLLVTQDLVLFEITLGELHSIIRDLIFELQSLGQLRGHTLVLSELPPQFSGARLRVNWEFLRKGFRELLLNAMKFSPENTRVTVLVEYFYSRVVVTILNEPMQDGNEGILGIPEEFRRVIFDPFFRISRTVHEQYQTLEYGLGLTFVEKIIHMHQANIRCLEVDDHFQTGDPATKLVAFEIELPS